MSLESIPSKKPSRVILAGSALIGIIAVVLFWLVRTWYWGAISEAPFSDMNDNYVIAHKFLASGDLSHTPFWQSYQKPTISIVGAFVFWIVGEQNLDGWRVSLALMTFASLAWLAWEVAKASKSYLLGASLILIVALSKSSVFWSYKFATEGLAEAFTYFICAFALYLYRKPEGSPFRYVLFGIVFMSAVYNRPNTVIVSPFIGLAFLTRDISWRNRSYLKRNIIQILCLGLGMSLVIIPWVVRAYNLYGKVLLSPTQGAYSFLWELGAVPKTEPDGTVTIRDVRALQIEAPTRFANDYEAMQHAKTFSKAWLKDNWNDLYPRLIRNRFFSSIENHDIALSKVPRKILFGNWKDRFVFDKTPLRFYVGVFGLFLGSLLIPGFFLIAAQAVLPWAFGLLFLSDPRLLEPTLPLVLFGNVVLLFSLFTYAFRPRLLQHS